MICYVLELCIVARATRVSIEKFYYSNYFFFKLAAVILLLFKAHHYERGRSCVGGGEGSENMEAKWPAVTLANLIDTLCMGTYIVPCT